MLLTVLIAGALLGAAASVPLLGWGRRLNRQRTAALEVRCSLCVTILLLPAFSWLLFAHPFLAVGLLGLMAMVSIPVVTGFAGSGGVCHWRGLLYSLTMIALVLLLTDLYRIL